MVYSAATKAAAVYAEHNIFHSPLNVQPFKGEEYVDDIPLRHATQNDIVMVPVTNTSTKDEGVSAMPLQLSHPKVENNTMKIKN